MFPYYGRKKNIVSYYPIPKYDIIIEPFAGSASYSLMYHEKQVILCELDPCIYNIWYYLINIATPKKIISLPLLKQGETLFDKKFDNLEQAEKDLIGFFIKSSCARPNKIQSSHKNYNLWTFENKKKLSEDIKKVKHWKVFNGSFKDLGNVKATWFIDAPYQGAGGNYYKFSNKKIDFNKLKKWCLSRKGQIIVCENEEANWLDFEPLITSYQRGNRHVEMIYYKE